VTLDRHARILDALLAEHFCGKPRFDFVAREDDAGVRVATRERERFENPGARQVVDRDAARSEAVIWMLPPRMISP
jgi:hypothetical protein